MTTWDKIYKNYQKGGDAWATLSEGIHPLFVQFFKQSKLEQKYALDIGCGTGKYLKFLQANGFKTDGIDSSETAVVLTKKLLGDDSKIDCANMFDFNIPINKYDLIISVFTIHHGTKDQIKSLIDKIYSPISTNGKIFITLPDFESEKKRDNFKDHQEVSTGTFAPLHGPEKGLPHSFYTKTEATKLFSKFNNVTIDLDNIGRFVIIASK